MNTRANIKLEDKNKYKSNYIDEIYAIDLQTYEDLIYDLGLNEEE